MPQDSSRRRERRSRSTSSSRHDDKKHIKRYDRTDRHTKRDYNDDYRDHSRRKYRRSRSRDYTSRRTNRQRSSRSKSRYRSRTPRSRSRSHNNKRSDRTSSIRDREEHKSRHALKKKSRRSKSRSVERDTTPVPPEPPRISDHDDVKPESSCDNSRSGDEISNINDINLPNENYSTFNNNNNNNRNSKPNHKSKAETYKYYGDDSNIEELDKEKIQQEMQERLRQHLASEGKVYPPPKPQQASHPFFANDGSFLETFKRIQEQQQMFCQSYVYQPVCSNVTSSVPTNITSNELNKFDNHPSNSNIVTQQQQQLQQPQYQSMSQPIFGKRRGGKILKTGIVEKPRPIQDLDGDNVKDAWSMYMQEVKKYKNSACDISSKTRPLLK